jgi:hypothetical protein
MPLPEAGKTSVALVEAEIEFTLLVLVRFRLLIVVLVT